MLNLVFNNFTTDKKYGLKFFKSVVQGSANKLGFAGKNIELSINLVGENKIKALNKKYLGKYGSTDVLSFPLGDRVSIKSADNDIMALGDIFICLPVAKRRALEEGTSLNFKLAILTVHGLLHLAGYGHEKSAKEAKKMRELQEKILKRLAISD